MDFLRSAHRVPAVVSADGQTSTKIRWYKCKPGAKAFPGFHAFGSAIWEPHPDEWTQGPGVEVGPLEWRPSGINAPPGREFHGQQEWFEKGIPREVLDNPEPRMRPPCIPAPIPFGVRVGLGVRPSGEVFSCPGVEPPTVLPVPMVLRFASRTGDFLNPSTYQLPALRASANKFVLFREWQYTFPVPNINNFVFFKCSGGEDTGVLVTVRQFAFGSNMGILSRLLSPGWSFDPIWTTGTGYSAVRLFPYSELDLSSPISVGTFTWSLNGIGSQYQLLIG